jgi:lactate dehydrogenase-like 2-hydroxyacid dehydrogenase
MTEAKIEVLVTAPLLPSLMAAVEREFAVDKLWLAPDRGAYLRERGASIRGVVTTALVGADAALMQALPRLQIISVFGVGYDTVDIEAARQRGIIVTNTPGVLTDCVADTAMALLLAVTRRICEADRYLRAGKWLQGRFPLSTKVGGKNCCLAGLGNVGQAIATRARAFAMNIGYYDPYPKPDLGYRRYEDLEAMAREADFLMLALPGGKETYRLIDARILAALGPKGILINVARGSVLDQQALVEALTAEKIAGAGLDVFENEPQVPAELLKMDNVVLTPHLASGTYETREAMGQLAFANLHAHFCGAPIPARVV